MADGVILPASVTSGRMVRLSQGYQKILNHREPWMALPPPGFVGGLGESFVVTDVIVGKLEIDQENLKNHLLVNLIVRNTSESFFFAM